MPLSPPSDAAWTTDRDRARADPAASAAAGTRAGSAPAPRRTDESRRATGPSSGFPDASTARRRMVGRAAHLSGLQRAAICGNVFGVDGSEQEGFANVQRISEGAMDRNITKRQPREIDIEGIKIRLPAREEGKGEEELTSEGLATFSTHSFNA